MGEFFLRPVNPTTTVFSVHVILRTHYVGSHLDADSTSIPELTT